MEELPQSDPLVESPPADEASATPAAPSSSPPAPPRRRALIGRWIARVVLVLTLLVGMLLSLTPQGHAVVRAGMLLTSVLGAANATDTHDRADVHHTAHALMAAGGHVYLDIFEPALSSPLLTGARPAIILISGVGDNRQSPQLINLADSFAESGVVTVTLTTDDLLGFSLAPADADAVVQAFQWLARYPGVNQREIGLVGLSAGSGLMCLGAADPRIRDQVAYVTLFGGYYDTTDLVSDIGRQALLFDGKTEAWQAQLVPVQVLAHSVAPVLPGEEGYTLKAAFDNGFVPISPTVLKTLSPATVAIYHLLAGDEPTQVAANLAQLTPAIQALLTNLSPASVVGQIHAKIFLLHDRHDLYVPFTESRHFAAALQAAGHSYSYVEFDIFAHVEVKGDLPLGSLLRDGAHLFGILYDLLRYGG